MLRSSTPVTTLAASSALLSSALLGAALSLAAGALSMSAVVGCSDRISSCESRRTCPQDASGGKGSTETGDGDGDGTGAEGGASSGGKSGTGGTETGSSPGSGGAEDPCSLCEGQTPVCLDEECVACTETDRGACSESEHCSPAQECVACLENEHCTDPAASACDPATSECTGCEGDEDCAHLSETPLCEPETQTCAACLSEADCGGNVCDPSTHECTSLPAGALFQCEPCEYDAECMPGRLCVEHVFPFDPEAPDPQPVGSYCTWTKAALVGEDEICFENGRPFADDATLTSKNGSEPTEFCVLATTTCQGYLDHRQPHCTSAADDASCGAAGIPDAQCELKGGSTYLCTYPCLGDEDCPASSTCNAASKYCSL